MSPRMQSSTVRGSNPARSSPRARRLTESCPGYRDSRLPASTLSKKKELGTTCSELFCETFRLQGMARNVAGGLRVHRAKRVGAGGRANRFLSYVLRGAIHVGIGH